MTITVVGTLDKLKTGCSIFEYELKMNWIDRVEKIITDVWIK